MIVRKLDNIFIHRKMSLLFKKHGIGMIERGNVFSRIKNILVRERGIVMVMIDQNSSKGNLYVPFFGKKASTMTGPFHLYQQTNAETYFISCQREGEKLHFDLKHFSNPPQTILPFFKDLHEHLEEVIKKNPDQYMWLHPRWKKQRDKNDYIYGKLRV